MTNPYQTPPEVDWQNSTHDANDGESLGRPNYFVKLALMASSIAFSGACFGAVFGLFLGSPASLFAGLVIGLIAAFIPSVMISMLCFGVVAMLPNQCEYGNNLICGMAGGALAGFVSVMVLLTGLSFDSQALLIATLASVFGAGGGLCGAFLVNRRLVRHRIATRMSSR